MPDQAPLRTSFDAVAALYDDVRPGYPDPIIAAIVERSRLPAAGRIVEVGCGTGQITRPFAERGYALLALEAELARFGNVLTRHYETLLLVAHKATHPEG